MQYKALLILLLVIGLPGVLISPAFTNSLVQTDLNDASDLPVGTGPTLTPTLCPQATPEPLWVDPVLSPTGILTQTVVIYIGNGEWAGVTLETGVYTQTGNFDAYNNPAAIQIDLLPNNTHHLIASGRVKEGQYEGCPYGGYTLTTTLDREGNPLTIIQWSNLIYFPIIQR
jgi:hypothetical protein